MAQAKNLQQPNDSSVAQSDNDPNATAMIGGPGQEDVPNPENPPAASETREVKIHGRNFQVSADLAQTLEQRDREFDRTLNEKLAQRDRDIQQLRALLPKPEIKTPGYDTLLFEDPNRAIQQIKQEIRAELSVAYDQDQKLQAFWRDFYAGNTDINPSDDGIIVRALLNEHLAELAPMRAEDAARSLADLTRKEILRISQKARVMSDGKDNVSRTTVEPASRGLQNVPIRESAQPATLSEIIRHRRRARMGKTAAA